MSTKLQRFPKKLEDVPHLKESKYTLRDRIGQGGEGRVYQVEDINLADKLAAKVLDWQTVQKHRTSEAFFRDAQIASAFDHPNIVKHSGLYQDENHRAETEVILLTELLDHSLTDYIGEVSPRKSEEELLRILREAKSGLQYLHEQGYAHRDIKPANIMFDSGGTVKITDFGMAKDLSAETAMSSLGKGTFVYMSPEQLGVGPGKYVTGSPEADLYSLGLTILATALKKERTDDIRFQKPNDDLEKLVGYDNLKAELKVLLNEDPAKRYGEVNLDITQEPTNDETDSSIIKKMNYWFASTLASSVASFGGGIVFVYHGANGNLLNSAIAAGIGAMGLAFASIGVNRVNKLRDKLRLLPYRMKKKNEPANQSDATNEFNSPGKYVTFSNDPYLDGPDVAIEEANPQETLPQPTYSTRAAIFEKRKGQARLNTDYIAPMPTTKPAVEKYPFQLYHEPKRKLYSSNKDKLNFKFEKKILENVIKTDKIIS